MGNISTYIVGGDRGTEIKRQTFTSMGVCFWYVYKVYFSLLVSRACARE